MALTTCIYLLGGGGGVICNPPLHDTIVTSDVISLQIFFISAKNFGWFKKKGFIIEITIEQQPIVTFL